MKKDELMKTVTGELKTLKDLKYLRADENWFPVYEFDEDVLKQEAIKWIKELKHGTFNIMEDDKLLIRADNQYLINWIKHFFNITEENLK